MPSISPANNKRRRIQEAKASKPMVELERANRGRSWLAQFMACSERLPLCICLSDSEKPDFPLVFVNAEFERVTGYERSECVGRNCRFLTGPETDGADTKTITNALSKGEKVCHIVRNHKKNGEVFRNFLMLKASDK